jgi:hypothetical protein
MNDESDIFARCFQAACAIPLLAFALVATYFTLHSGILGFIYMIRTGLAVGSYYLAYRCLRYAITGRNNINRDDF